MLDEEICVVGCGAVGSIFAAHLARLEEVEVFAYDVGRSTWTPSARRACGFPARRISRRRLHAT